MKYTDYLVSKCAYSVANLSTLNIPISECGKVAEVTFKFPCVLVPPKDLANIIHLANYI